MSLDNAKKFIQMITDDEGLRKRTANMKPEEVIAAAGEIGLFFTEEELKKTASNFHDLKPDELIGVSGGAFPQVGGGKNKDPLRVGNTCPNGPDGKHQWVKTGQYQDEWFGWIKDGGLWSYTVDKLECAHCGMKIERYQK